MQILSLKTVGSTQTYLKELIRTKKVKPPYAVVARTQTAGIGSRENEWHSLSGNLFLSFAISLKNLPTDLKLESSSIYFAHLLKETLNELNSKVWLKWPNDFYIDNKKIGGMITTMLDDCLICGVGLNIATHPDGFEKLDITVCLDDLLDDYFIKLEKYISWKQVFSKYELDFHCNKTFFTHNENLRVSLDDAKLLRDGSIMINNQRIYSQR